MNILVPFSWLKDFLKTEASAEKIAETLSLCSQSVERIHEVDEDKILDIEITVNRYDCLSVVGIAREAAAILPQFGIKATFIPPKTPSSPEFKKTSKDNHLKVEIRNPGICPRFSAILTEGVKIAPSPNWLTKRLEKIGIRSINNIVDISNYLMMETGQPIHTFDYDKIIGQKMIMRLSKKGEVVITLDGVTRTLQGEDIVIEDGSGRLIDLCGIMGGQNSEIDSQTKRVLFFVQAYDPVRIRKTSMSLGLRTEAAARFERGIDLEGIVPVVYRGVEMIKELAGGKASGGLIDIYPQKQINPKIKVSLSFINERLGINLPRKEGLKILSSLGFIIKSQSANELTVTAPSWRAKDIQIQEDLLEEIARVYGYFRLPSKIPPLNESYGLVPQPKPQKGTLNPSFRWEEIIKDYLKSVGFSETYNFSFISQFQIENSGLKVEEHLKIKNPITSDLEYLRISLLPSLLAVSSKNLANFPKIKIFEMANIYLPQKNNLPDEKMRLSGLTNTLDFYQLKGLLIELLKQLGIIDFEIIPVTDQSIEPFWQKETMALIYHKKDQLGVFGQIKNLRSLFSTETFGFLGFDLNLEKMTFLANENKIYLPIPKFPPIIEDLSFVFPERTPVGPIIQLIKAIDRLVNTVELIDLFEETRTFRITYQHPDKNLTDEEVKKIREKIIKLFEKKSIRLKLKD